MSPHFTTDINCPKRRYRQKKILASTLQRTFRYGFLTPGKRKFLNNEHPFYFITDIFLANEGVHLEKIFIVPHFVRGKICPKNRSGQERILRRKPHEQGLGKALPNKIPTGQNERRSEFWHRGRILLLTTHALLLYCRLLFHCLTGKKNCRCPHSG